jgi:hypothetical protein
MCRRGLTSQLGGVIWRAIGCDEAAGANAGHFRGTRSLAAVPISIWRRDGGLMMEVVSWKARSQLFLHFMVIAQTALMNQVRIRLNCEQYNCRVCFRTFLGDAVGGVPSTDAETKKTQ